MNKLDSIHQQMTGEEGGATWQQRLFQERDQLDERIRKLDAFHHSEKYRQLPKEDQRLMTLQLRHMNDYNMVLTERILRLPRGVNYGGVVQKP